MESFIPSALLKDCLPNQRHAEAHQAVYSRIAAAITALIGLAALCGWAFHVPALASVLPGSVQMQANTALCITACGAAQLILANRASYTLQRLAQLLALIPIVIGLITLGEYFSQWPVQIDELLFKDTAQAFNPFSGRMSPFSATAFVAIGIALASIPIARLKRVSQFSAALVVIVGIASLVGYLWNAHELVTDSWLPPVAINAASCFVLLGSSVLFSPAATLSLRVSRLAEVEIRVLSGFIFAMVLLVFGGNYAYRANVRFADSVAWVTHTQEVRATVANVYGALAGAELALRDYLIYGQPDRWEEHQRLILTVQERLHALQELTDDNPAQQTNVTALKSLVEGRISDMASIVLANQQYGLPAARAVTRALQGSHSTRAVETLVDRMESIEAQLLAARQSAAERVRRSTLISLLITLIIAAALFFGLFRSIHRAMRARRDAEDALRASDQYNRSIIDSSPDCVAILDLDARLSQMTPHGLALMGIDDFSTVANSDWLETWSGETREDALRAVVSARHGAAGRFSGLYKTKTGISTYWDVIVMPILGADGHATQLLAVARDITERKLTEEAIHDLNVELREKAAQLEATNKELESFTYSVSHDLRAPLRAVDGFALMIEEDCKDRLDAEGQRYLAVIRDNSQKMGILIDDLLVFSRLGRQPVASRDINVDSLVREVVAEVVSAGSTTKFDIGPLPLVRGDRGLLRQVWINLIANAVKYSAKVRHPHVQITGVQMGAENQYSVRDNGVGFDMAYAANLFGVFQRLHRPDEFEGTGVGLAIVHRIVTRHGGRVWADGKVNEGATFSFALPNGENHG